MLKAVALANPHKLLVINKIRSNAGFYPFVACFFKKSFYKRAVGRVVNIHPQMVLLAVDFCHKDILIVGAPSNVGKKPIDRRGCLQVDGAFFGKIVNTHANLVRCFARHRIAERIFFGNTLSNIYFGIFCHHTLVHTVKSKTLARWRPKNTLFDTELVAVNRCAVHHTPTLATVDSGLTIAAAHNQVAFVGICHIAVAGSILKISVNLLDRIAHSIFCQIYQI